MLTVAKNNFPSSLPTPSNTFNRPESVTKLLLCSPIEPITGDGGPYIPGTAYRGTWLMVGYPESPSSRGGNAQSMSSMRKMECLGIEEAAFWRKESSTLKGDRRHEYADSESGS